MPTGRPVPYHIFLLTCWLDAAEDRADPETWRFRLEEPRLRRRHSYVGVNALVGGLMSAVNDDEDAEEG